MVTFIFLSSRERHKFFYKNFGDFRVKHKSFGICMALTSLENTFLKQKKEENHWNEIPA